MTADPNAEIPLIAGLSSLADRYDAFFCDVWGVLHNGVQTYEPAVPTLKKLKALGKTVILLSNSPRMSGNLHSQLQSLGIPRDAYDFAVTSGDATHAVLEERRFGQNGYFLGPDRDLPLIEATSVSYVDPDQADFVLCTGLLNDEVEEPKDYRAQLTLLAAKGLPFLCANPDIVVERGDRLIYCAGALGALYEELGGSAHFFGKPHAPIYELGVSKLVEHTGKEISKDRILAIGDGLGTDIRGADAQGIDSLFITGGIAATELGPDADHPDRARIAAACRDAGVSPLAATPRLTW